MRLVLAVCGMPASGKGEFANILANNSIPVRSMGDMVRAEVATRNLEESPHIFGEIAADLRAKYGDDVLATRLVSVVDELLKEHPIVLIEGLRGTAEKDLFQSAWSEQFQVVAIIADDETRFSRMQSRGRSEDGDRTDFEKRNQREKGWGLEQLISEADYQFSNNGDLSALTDEVSKWFNSL